MFNIISYEELYFIISIGMIFYASIIIVSFIFIVIKIIKPNNKIFKEKIKDLKIEKKENERMLENSVHEMNKIKKQLETIAKEL
jgi:hypothetical protein